LKPGVDALIAGRPLRKPAGGRDAAANAPISALKSHLAGPGEIAMIPPHCSSLVDGASQVARRLIVLVKGGCKFLHALRFSAVTLALACGCQNDGELANPSQGLARSLAPRSVDDYARQRNISREQAQRELQDAVSKRDAAEAEKNIDEAGVVTTH